MGLLGRMGLKNNESRVYLACLKQKKGLFIYEIVRATRLTRSTVDMLARRLVQRGFLNRVRVGRRTNYLAAAPEALLFRQKQLTEDWEQVVPLLAQEQTDGTSETEITYFEGIQGFRRAMMNVLLNIQFASGVKKDVLAFSSGPDLVRAFPDHQRAFIAKRIRSGSWYRAIATQASAALPAWHSNGKELRIVKYIPDAAFNFRLEMCVYADQVMLYSLAKPIGGVVIHNERIADSMRALFNLVWRLLPPEEGAS